MIIVLISSYENQATGLSVPCSVCFRDLPGILFTLTCLRITCLSSNYCFWVISDWTLAPTSPSYTRDKYLPYLDLCACLVGSYWGLQGYREQWENTAAICSFWNKWIFSSSWLRAWLGARVPVIYYWSTAIKSLYFQYFDKIALLDPNTGWFDMFLVLPKMCNRRNLWSGHNPAHIKFRDIFHIYLAAKRKDISYVW